MKNYAGPWNEEKDKAIAEELLQAGITSHNLGAEWGGEVHTKVMGTLEPWCFHRAWYYWVAAGPGIPPQYARALHKGFGNEVRVAGHAGCPGPEWYRGFAVGLYHVDSQIGLKALADTIKLVLEEAKLNA